MRNRAHSDEARPLGQAMSFATLLEGGNLNQILYPILAVALAADRTPATAAGVVRPSYIPTTSPADLIGSTPVTFAWRLHLELKGGVK